MSSHHKWADLSCLLSLGPTTLLILPVGCQHGWANRGLQLTLATGLPSFAVRTCPGQTPGEWDISRTESRSPSYSSLDYRHYYHLTEQKETLWPREKFSKLSWVILTDSKWQKKGLKLGSLTPEDIFQPVHRTALFL